MTQPTRSDVYAVDLIPGGDHGDVDTAVAAAKQLSLGPDKPAVGVFLGPGSSSVFGAYLIDLSSTKPGGFLGGLFGRGTTPIHIEGQAAAFELHPFAAAVVDGETVVRGNPKFPA